MASLQRVDDYRVPDPRLSFNLELVGFEKYGDGKVSNDWLEVRTWLVVFGLKIEPPIKGSMDLDELEMFIGWLRGLASSTKVNSFQTSMEPLFSIETRAHTITEGAYDVKALITAYGSAPGFYSSDEGVSVSFSTKESAVTSFAAELDKELTRVRHG